MTKEEVLKSFWDSILKGESGGYNDHNWYVGDSLRGYMEGRSGSRPYPLLKKPLVQTTIGDLKSIQGRTKYDSNGKMWATGRYQIIPDTLLGLLKRVPLKDSDLYNRENQDKLGWELIKERKGIFDYINGSVADTTDNLNKASLEMAKIWASLGVPYATNGVKTDQSYYNKNGVDRASVSSQVVKEKLKELRNNFKYLISEGVEIVKKKPLLTIGLTIVFCVAFYSLYKQLKK